MNIFVIFPRKQDFTFHANLSSRGDSDEMSSYFLEIIKRILTHLLIFKFSI